MKSKWCDTALVTSEPWLTGWKTKSPLSSLLTPKMALIFESSTCAQFAAAVVQGTSRLQLPDS